MTQSHVALATARRNVVHRITRFIEMLEQAPREPDAWEGEYIQRALRALGELDFPRGGTAMMWAEWSPDRRTPDAMSNLHPVHDVASTTQLRSQLDGALQ